MIFIVPTFCPICILVTFRPYLKNGRHLIGCLRRQNMFQKDRGLCMLVRSTELSLTNELEDSQLAKKLCLLKCPVIKNNADNFGVSADISLQCGECFTVCEGG